MTGQRVVRSFEGLSNELTAAMLSIAFRNAGSGISFDDLDRDPSVIYGLLPDGTLGYYNQAWASFAVSNGLPDIESIWPLGSQVSDAIPWSLRPFYEMLWETAKRRGVPVTHEYECSSPNQVRRYIMRVLPLAEDAVLIVNALRLAEERGETHLEGVVPESYVRNGVIMQCSHCRRVRRSESEDWDFVADYVARPRANVSHGLCRPCLQYHYLSRIPE